MMDGKKNDRRVRKTKKTLIDALTVLMAQKRINKITVTELTELADVNRSTFYLYYKDIYDMVEKVESEMLEDFTEAFNKCFNETYKCDAAFNNLSSFVTFLFEFVKSNAKMCKILLGPDGDYAFLQKLKNIIKSQPGFETDVHNLKLRYYDPFIISGCIGIIQEWLDNDMKEDPKDMAAMVIDLIQTELL